MKARLQGGKIGGLTLDMGDSLTNFEDSLKDMGDHTLRLHTEGDKDSFGISMDDENFRVDGNVWEGSGCLCEGVGHRGAHGCRPDVQQHG